MRQAVRPHNIIREKGNDDMELIKLKNMSLSARLFISLLLCLLGLSYLALLWGIWIDTEMKIAYIIEGYADFESMELVEHTFKYIFWFIGTFGITVSLFLLTSWPEKLKRLFAVSVPLLIISDIGSMWVIRYSDFFAWQLYFSGILLATSFLALFLLIQFDMWVKVIPVRKKRRLSKIELVSKEVISVLERENEPLSVKEIDFHLDCPPEMVHMSLGWLIRKEIIFTNDQNDKISLVSRSPLTFDFGQRQTKQLLLRK